MNAHTTEEYKGWTIEIHYDEDGESPRDWDNLGFMACWHQRGLYGDNPVDVSRYTPKEWLLKEVSEFENTEDLYWDEVSDEKAWKMFEKYYIWLPINAYEHGGITISSGRFSDAWDSGQLGFIYISKEKALKEFSQKRWSKKLEDKVLNILKGEIETYDQYLNGDVHGFMTFRPEDEDCENSVDSCWGFYGTEDCLNEAKQSIDGHIENDKKQEQLFNSCMSL